jgi:imidazoleglycerol-phosphate dehydratase
MLDLFAAHGLFDLHVDAQGDVDVDDHHTVEDVGLCLGDAVAQALGDKTGIVRYGFFLLPMDEALAEVALDLSGRPFVVFDVDWHQEKIKNFDVALVEEFWHAFGTRAQANLHVRSRRGTNAHHVCEAIFKATARALAAAVRIDPRRSGVPSTKGTLTE